MRRWASNKLAAISARSRKSASGSAMSGMTARRTSSRWADVRAAVTTGCRSLVLSLMNSIPGQGDTKHCTTLALQSARHSFCTNAACDAISSQAACQQQRPPDRACTVWRAPKVKASGDEGTGGHRRRGGIRTIFVFTCDLKNILKPLPGAVDAALDRTECATADLSRFLIGKAGRPNENDRLALIGWKRVQRPLEILQIERAVLGRMLGKRFG